MYKDTFPLLSSPAYFPPHYINTTSRPLSNFIQQQQKGSLHYLFINNYSYNINYHHLLQIRWLEQNRLPVSCYLSCLNIFRDTHRGRRERLVRPSFATSKKTNISCQVNLLVERPHVSNLLQRLPVKPPQVLEVSRSHTDISQVCPQS